MIRKYIPQKTRKIIYDKYKGHCAYCGNEITFKQMQVDHLQPLIFNGTDDLENLMPSCAACNGYKCHSNLKEFRMYLKQMFETHLQYLFKSKTKMQVAINFGVIKIEKWDGLFYFEKI